MQGIISSHIQKIIPRYSLEASGDGMLIELGHGAADTLHSPLLAQNLHNGVQVGGVGFACDSQTDKGGNVTGIRNQLNNEQIHPKLAGKHIIQLNNLPKC